MVHVENIREVTKFSKPKAFFVSESLGEAFFQEVIANKGSSKVFGVSTSLAMTEDECKDKFGVDLNTHVFLFAKMLAMLGADGIVCSFEQGSTLKGYQSALTKLSIACPSNPRHAREMVCGCADYVIVGINKNFSAWSLERLATEIALGLNDRKFHKESPI